MGATYDPPDDRLEDTYVKELNRGYVAKLDYTIKGYSGFWLKLLHADLSEYRTLTFDIRGDQQVGIPKEFKVEFKRTGQVSFQYVSDITANWATREISLDTTLLSSDHTAPVSSWTGMEELVFIFEAEKSGSRGVVYLDNVAFCR